MRTSNWASMEHWVAIVAGQSIELMELRLVGVSVILAIDFVASVGIKSREKDQCGAPM